MLQSQEQSGLTVEQWCEEHGIRENAYGNFLDTPMPLHDRLPDVCRKTK